MALIGILFFIFTATCVGASSFFNESNTESFGKHGQQSLLQCVVKTREEAVDMEINTVSWTKKGVEKALLFFYEGKTTLQTDYMFAEPSWNSKNMNVSLLITNTMVEHAGIYICTVETDFGVFKETTNFTVTAKYSEPTVSSVLGKITQNTNGHQKGAASREDEKSDSTSKIVAPVVVIGFLIIGLVMVLLYLRRRKDGHVTNNAREEQEGEEEKGLRNKDDDRNLV
ncbi:uncharacterized protein LOC133015342 [Limanda limanda]|uniref:uncharacterized protein LOC133015342 n=1 Tax=Limanda limanda TaxID=27771 RepID=UPI0029C7DB41|nr:uncharacterized protein LOC133015342 [Limanda limanda]